MREGIVFLILGMALVTFLPRFFPMAFLNRRALPERVKKALEYFPISILSAIVFPMFFSNGGGKIEVQTQHLIAAIPVFLFAWKVKSLWGSVILGMVVYWVLGFVLK